jgi:hypothetical protein
MLYARNLDDAGGIPNSTISTEIRRGAQAAAACALKAESDNVVLADCAYRVHEHNLAENTGTKAFTLGLFFEGWRHAAASPQLQYKRSAERAARDFFYLSKYHAQELGIDPGVVCAVIENNCDEILPMWNEWKDRIQRPMQIR